MPSHSFDIVAPVYDSLAKLIFGSAITQAQLVNLEMVPAKAKILVIGGGTGWFLLELLQNTNCSRVVYVEASKKMLYQARQLLISKYGQECKTEFRLGNENNITPAEKYDVVITNFFLDLFAPAPLQYITDKLYTALTPGGYWFITDFIKPDATSWKKIWSSVLLRGMYIFFRVTCQISATTLPDWEHLLKQYSLKGRKSGYFYYGLIKSVVLQKEL